MSYSSCNNLVTKLRRLLELPNRPANEPSPRAVSIRRRPTRAERDELAEAYRTGATVYQLASLFGMHRDTVSATLERAGIARRYHATVDVDLALADELHAGGLSITRNRQDLWMGFGRSVLPDISFG